MATIKVPYIYTSYSFSEKATKYSKRLSKGQYSWGVPAFFIATFGAFLIETQLLGDLGAVSDFMVLVLLGLPVLLGVVAAIYVEKLRKRFFLSKIRKALEEDLARIAETDPARAAAYRAQLGDFLESK